MKYELSTNRKPMIVKKMYLIRLIRNAFIGVREKELKVSDVVVDDSTT